MCNFLSDSQRAALAAQGLLAQHAEDFDPFPLVKLFTPDAGATWLLAAIDPQDPDSAYGLCDLGLGFPELGWVSLVELAEVRGLMNRPIAQDAHFRATQRLSRYAKEARMAGRIQA